MAYWGSMTIIIWPQRKLYSLTLMMSRNRWTDRYPNRYQMIIRFFLLCHISINNYLSKDSSGKERDVTEKKQRGNIVGGESWRAEMTIVHVSPPPPTMDNVVTMI